MALGRFHLCPLNEQYARWLPPSWGCAPSHLPPGGRYKRSPLQGNVTGRWRGSSDSQKIPVRIVSGDSPRLPPSWGCAPSHLPPVGRYKRSPLQGNVTGRWRGSSDSQKIIVRIATGGTPAGAGGAVTIRRRLSCALSAATRRGSLWLGAAPQATADCQSSATLFFQKTSKGVFQSRHFLGR